MGLLGDLFGDVGDDIDEAFDNTIGAGFRTIGGVVEDVVDEIEGGLGQIKSAIFGDRPSGRENIEKHKQLLIKRGQSVKTLFDEITADETISDLTKQELLFSFSELDPRLLQFRGQDFNPDLETPGSPITEALAPRSLTSAISGRADIAGIESKFRIALEGKDKKFRVRQTRQKASNRLKDQPGSRQFLVDSPSRSTLTPTDKDTQTLPSLT